MTTELVLVSSIAVVGLVAGMTTLKTALSNEISSLTEKIHSFHGSNVTADEDKEVADHSSERCTNTYAYGQYQQPS